MDDAPSTSEKTPRDLTVFGPGFNFGWGSEECTSLLLSNASGLDTVILSRMTQSCQAQNFVCPPDGLHSYPVAIIMVIAVPCDRKSE